MMKRNHTRLCASAAIAAALALSSTPLLAHVAEAPPPPAPDPVLTIPTTPAPPPAQPAIVIPTEIEAAAAPTTVTTPERATPVPTTTTRTERAAAPAARPARRAPVAAPADPAPAPVAEEDERVVPVADTPAPETVAPVVDTEPAPAPADNDNALQFGIAVLAAVAALVLAIWGFIAIGRRRPVDRKAATLIERPVVTPAQPEPLAAAAPSTVTPMATARAATASPAPSLSHTGASVPLPSKMPETFEERDALIKRMIAAKPDRANPFTSPIQRRKRAKLILQSLGRDFGGREPWIDLSQYSQNWPELAGRKHAAA